MKISSYTIINTKEKREIKSLNEPNDTKTFKQNNESSLRRVEDRRRGQDTEYYRAVRYQTEKTHTLPENHL